MSAAPLDPGRLREVLQQLQRGERSVDEALQLLTAPPRATDLGFATVDHDRAARCGFPEVVFCQGKTPADAAHIAAEILTRADRVLLTRATAEHAAAVAAVLPRASYHQRARCITVAPAEVEEHGLVAVVCAGTADLPVAEEAAVTLRIAGNRVQQFTDIGVAGLHRLLARVPEIRAANAIVAVAGMEGALPSVLAGLVDRPVFAVPTSVGYGASFGGLTALLSMLNSCAAGVAVVNIDNGFGAGYLACLVNRRIAQATPQPPSQPPHPSTFER
ncbi:MAG: nickel pincer cofactor biosynthesis protein LarB [Planctomycetes bacterium]|nr:nickel pincer cofactor biosynthesis protein LarB [Planctomycetota bacterium]